MRIFNLIFKRFFDLFSFVVRRNRDAVKYLLSVALKEQVIDYVENQYFKLFLHIEKSINLYKSLALPGEQIVVDAGGGTGKTATIFLEQMPNSKIFVFEPIKNNFQTLEKQFSNKANVVLYNMALGNFKGRSTIHIANRITSSSILELKPSGIGSNYDKNITPVSHEEITVDKLDNLFKEKMNIGILKLDVQGFELEVLKGAENCLKNTCIIIAEVNNHSYFKNAPRYYDIDTFLRNNHFTIANIFPNFFISNRLMEWDVIYINNKFL